VDGSDPACSRGLAWNLRELNGKGDGDFSPLQASYEKIRPLPWVRFGGQCIRLPVTFTGAVREIRDLPDIRVFAF